MRDLKFVAPSASQACTLFHKASLPVDEAWSQYRLALVMLKVRSASLALDYLLEVRCHILSRWTIPS